eukprot:gene12903-13029_t
MGLVVGSLAAADWDDDDDNDSIGNDTATDGGDLSRAGSDLEGDAAVGTGGGVSRQYKGGLYQQPLQQQGLCSTQSEELNDDDQDLAGPARGLIGANDRTGSTWRALEAIDVQWERSLNNTGGRQTGKRTNSNRGKKTKACLYNCSGVDGVDLKFSSNVAHLAGSPDVYSSTNPEDARAGKNLVSAVRDQGYCATCVSHVIASAAESAAAAAQRVEASRFDVSHSFAHHCAGQGGGIRSCGTGWSLAEALEDMIAAPQAFWLDQPCTAGVDPSTASLTDAELIKFCNKSVSSLPKCSLTAAFTCKYKTLSDGIVQVQRYIRAYGSVMTRLSVTPSFRQFFKANPTGVFNGTRSAPSARKDKGFLHAVLLVGEAKRLLTVDGAKTTHCMADDII